MIYKKKGFDAEDAVELIRTFIFFTLFLTKLIKIYIGLIALFLLRNWTFFKKKTLKNKIKNYDHNRLEKCYYSQ